MLEYQLHQGRGHGYLIFLRKVKVLVAQSCPTLRPPGLYPTRLLCPWGFFRQEYWSGLPCPPPGDLSNPGIEPKSPALDEDSLPSEPRGKPKSANHCVVCAVDINSVALLYKCACYLS